MVARTTARLARVGDARVPLDIDGYVARVRADARRGACFICDIVAGRREDHCVIARDELSITFLAKYATLRGYCIVAPVDHRTGVVADFTEDEYAALQRRVHRLGRAVSLAVPTERLYVLSLGSNDGNAHVHWHVAPLPPGVPYEQQQYAALTAENGVIELPAEEEVALAQRIAAFLSGNGVEVKQLTPDDWALWRVVRRRALREAPEVFGATFADWDGANDMASRWRSRLEMVPLNLVAFIDGEPVGQLSGTAPDEDGRVELISMFVAPEARRRGVGRALVGSVVEWASERAPGGVVLGVKRSNTAAIALYERCGFRLAPARDGLQADEQSMARPRY
jgi:ribosomal protein S18 acetylase RimI-like enzyme